MKKLIFLHGKNHVTKIIRANYAGGRFKEEWKELCHKVSLRDNFKCRKCGRHRDTCKDLGLSMEVDHIVPISRGGTDDISNLQYLCSKCHDKRPRHHHLLRLRRK